MYIRTLNMFRPMRGKLDLGDLGVKLLSLVEVGVVKGLLCLRV
jgi:hypothetical protein